MNPILPVSTLLTASSLAQTQQTGASKTTKTHLGSPEKAKENLDKLVQKSGEKNVYEADYEYAVFVVSFSKKEAIDAGFIPENLKDSLPDSENLTFGISFLNHGSNLEENNQYIPGLEAPDQDRTNHHFGEVVVTLILPRDKTYYITQKILVDTDQALAKGNEFGIPKVKVDGIDLKITENGFKRAAEVSIQDEGVNSLSFQHESFSMKTFMKRKQKFSGNKDVSYESRYQDAKVGFGGVDDLKTPKSDVEEVTALQTLLKNGTVKMVFTGRAESVWEVLNTAVGQAE